VWEPVVCTKTYVGQTSRSLKLCYQEHIRHIKNNNPQSAYALNILQNSHEYGPMNQTMHLLKPINNTSSPIPYERLYIQSLHQERNWFPNKALAIWTLCSNWSLTLTTLHMTKPVAKAPSKLYTWPTQRLSGPPPTYKLGYVQFIQIFNIDKYFNHTTRPQPPTKLTTTLDTHNPCRTR